MKLLRLSWKSDDTEGVGDSASKGDVAGLAEGTALLIGGAGLNIGAAVCKSW
jgi:hypothetical protein